ncbi:hypothetical protein [Frankia sp. Cppng1_Ct_nod]|uniref:hypothetical protein n=1 Tax=Frankia sp. Cppng1_Ct_nod TaxID=2897162 RepID=UPI0013EF6208|nr:hypothetical protein [Frankia sp. Cppng1_Ct_nod]
MTGAASGLDADIGCTVRAVVGVAEGPAAGLTSPNEVRSEAETAAGGIGPDGAVGRSSPFMDPTLVTDGPVSLPER